MKVHEGIPGGFMNMYFQKPILSIQNALDKTVKVTKKTEKKFPKLEISNTHFGEEKERKQLCVMTMQVIRKLQILPEKSVNSS